ncbi:uncharacterized protein A4U43_C07F21750 [Asparagus officinalis]|uniref:Uncharacterized protein n=1 Tax=Asparagus officinalis TaxID=4686 RepID=A0A5P1EFS5_ASPOF|nr:uncharacterized protein A4U43_C07F21750 [Asparagus officinalis]
MGPRHFAAYEDSVFRHYVQFGPPGVDLPTFEHILSQWDKKSKKIVLTDRNDREEIACSFNLEWGPTAVDVGRARGPRDILHKKKRRAEDDNIPIDAVDIDEDVEQPNEAVEQMEWPQQVIYWKSIAAMNQALRRENENKFKDTPGTVGGIDIQYEGDVNQLLFDEANKESEDPPTGRASPQLFFSDIHKESEDAPLGEVHPPEAYRIDKALEAEINEGEKVSPPAKELLTCTETGTQREGTRREITPAVDVPSAGHDTETQTCIEKERCKGAREKVATAAPLKRRRCKRAVKPSKWVVTPYTKGKKKKEKDNIGDKAIIEVAGEEEEQVQEKVAELAPARLQSDPHSIWEKHMSSPMSSEEEMYRNKLNEGIPFLGGFIIKFLGDNDTFVHNYKVSADVAALLTEEEKKTLNHFCICRCNK